MSNPIKLQHSFNRNNFENTYNTNILVNSSILGLLSAYHDLDFITREELESYIIEFKDIINSLNTLKTSQDIDIAENTVSCTLSLLDSLTKKILIDNVQYIDYIDSDYNIYKPKKVNDVVMFKLFFDVFSEFPYFASVIRNNDKENVLTQKILRIENVNYLENRTINNNLYILYNELYYIMRRFGYFNAFYSSTKAYEYLNRRCAIVGGIFSYLPNFGDILVLFLKGRTKLDAQFVESNVYSCTLNSMIFALFYHYTILISYLIYIDSTFSVGNKIDEIFRGDLDGFNEINQRTAK